MTTTAAPPFPRHVIGTWKLIAPMQHGGDERLGTTTLFRTIGFIHERRKIQLPTVSGGSIRGVWRRACARRFLEVYREAGGEPISLSAFHYLTSGGSLHKGSSTASLDIAGEAELRTLIPHVGLFGGAGLGKIQEGKLYVDQALPICRETVPMLVQDMGFPEAEEAATATLSVRELLEERGNSRKDESKNPWWLPFLRDEDRRALVAHQKQREREEDAEEAGKAQQMRYSALQLVMGTELYHRWGTKWPATRDELAGFGAGLRLWAERPTGGGGSGHGQGNVLPRYKGVQAQTALLTDGSRPLTEFRQQTVDEALQEHVRENLADIQAVLGAL